METSDKLGMELSKILGLDSLRMYSMTISCKAREPATIDISGYLSTETGITEIFKHYEIIEKK